MKWWSGVDPATDLHSSGAFEAFIGDGVQGTYHSINFK